MQNAVNGRSNLGMAMQNAVWLAILANQTSWLILCTERVVHQICCQHVIAKV